MTTTRHELCEKIFFGVVDALALITVSLLITWLVESRMLVIDNVTPPQVVEVTGDYVDIQWHNRRLLDCPTEGQPAFYTPYATEQLPSRPVASDLNEQTFVQRYYFPAHLLSLHHAHARQMPDVVNTAELRITIIARCNPLWPTQQVVRVPFVMPRSAPR